MKASTWTALLSAGSSPVLKHGSASDAVRRVQRALNVAPGTDLKVSGVFTARMTTAVRRYQKARHLPRTGVVAGDTWRELEAGRR
jgi:peptidoglycan hydrolase-like protein with peptidoglycan-binding domain